MDGGSFFPALFDLRVHFFKFFELFLLPSTGVKYRSFIPSSFLLPMIYIIFFPYGTYHLLKTKKAETLIALLFIVMNIIYFTATGAVSSGQIKYHCMRYFTPTILIFAFFSFYGIFTFMNKSEGKILNKIIIPSIIGITILLTTIFFNPKIKRDIKTVFDSGTKVNLVFKSKKIDYVKLKPYPNFGKDGKMDYYFEGKFDSFYPISLWKVHVSYLKDKEIKWESRHSQIKGDKNIVGVGIVNEINKNIDYLSFGDNYRYNNFYLIRDKRIKLFLPVSKELKGKFKFTFFTNRGIFNKIINVR
jgi:hypothetical protein